VGVHKTWSASGKLFQEIEYAGGLPNGRWRQLREDGSLEIEGTMQSGKRSGEWRYLRPDGSLDPQWSGVYADDRKVNR
jgi:antitoxin component YwqK of YwqJK toxin-antitoxin module